MFVKIKSEGKTVTACLYGEIDHHAAVSIRQEIDFAIRDTDPDKLILDFSHVTFMDSSGIGLVMGRCRIMTEMGGKVIIRSPSPGIKKVMKLSKVDRLAEIKSEQQLS